LCTADVRSSELIGPLEHQSHSQVHDDFGLLSSVFDYLTFGALLQVFHTTQDQFRNAVSEISQNISSLPEGENASLFLIRFDFREDVHYYIRTFSGLQKVGATECEARSRFFGS
jgi:hypothetical protein